MKNVISTIKRAAPFLLSCAAGVGVIATAILSSKASVKAEILLEERETGEEKPSKIDTIKTIAPLYIPSIVVGAATIFCIFESNHLSSRQQLALISAYTLTKNKFDGYRSKVKEIYGEAAHQKIIDKLAIEPCKKVDITAPGIASYSSLDFGNDEELHIFHDIYSDRRFESTFSRVLQAEYYLNRDFALGKNVSLNDYYSFLGLEPTSDGDTVGWSFEEGYEWLDFNHRRALLDDGTVVFIIEMQFEPELDYDQW